MTLIGLSMAGDFAGISPEETARMIERPNALMTAMRDNALAAGYSEIEIAAAFALGQLTYSLTAMKMAEKD